MPPPQDRTAALDAVLDAVDVPVFVVDGRGRIERCNDAADRFAGYGPGELAGRAMQRVVPGWADDRAGATADGRRPAGDPLGRPHELRRRTGGLVPVSVGRRPVDLDGEPFDLVTVVDRREATVLREALAHSEARFRALVEASGDLVWVLDDAGLAREDAPSWRDYTGTSWEQFRGMAWHGQVHPADHATLPQLLRARRGPEPVEADIRVRGADGAWHPVAVRAAPVPCDAGEHVAWLCRARPGS